MTQAEVDAHVRRLWRHRGTTVPGPRRGPRGELDLDDILATAIALADASGLEAVSTRAVAARFGKTPMALYAYVGSKENLLSLMQDHASAMPSWPDPGTSLADDLLAWATAFFDLHLAHPWLTRRGWAEHTQGPHEQDWMERLLDILDRWSVAVRAPVVTMLYATVRATAETAAAYRQLTGDSSWLAQAEATRRLIPDLTERYPRSTTLPAETESAGTGSTGTESAGTESTGTESTGIGPAGTDWTDAPRAGLIGVVRLIAGATPPE